MIVHSVLLLGAPGSGKSHLAAEAAKHYGGAAIIGFPGADERNSYIHLLDKPGYSFTGFDDMWLPSIGLKEADGLTNALKHMQQLYKDGVAAGNAGEPLPFPLLIIDTVSGAGQLAFDATLRAFNLTEAPKARGDQGAPFYGKLRTKQEELMRMARALKGLGMHLIVTCHISERENVSEGAAATVSSKMLQPALPGGFRDILPSYFDNVLFAEVAGGKHVLRWKPSPKRASKSRLGDLSGDGSPIANSWSVLLEKMNAAVAAKAA